MPAIRRLSALRWTFTCSKTSKRWMLRQSDWYTVSMRLLICSRLTLNWGILSKKCVGKRKIAIQKCLHSTSRIRRWGRDSNWSKGYSKTTGRTTRTWSLIRLKAYLLRATHSMESSTWTHLLTKKEPLTILNLLLMRFTPSWYSCARLTGCWRPESSSWSYKTSIWHVLASKEVLKVSGHSK